MSREDKNIQDAQQKIKIRSESEKSRDFEKDGSVSEDLRLELLRTRQPLRSMSGTAGGAKKVPDDLSNCGFLHPWGGMDKSRCAWQCFLVCWGHRKCSRYRKSEMTVGASQRCVTTV